MDQNYQIEKEKKDAAVLRDNLDKTLMLAKALKAGTKKIASQNVAELKFTGVDNSNVTTAMATAFAGFN